MTLESEVLEQQVPKSSEGVSADNRIFVGNLSQGHNRAYLKELFAPAGKIIKIKVMVRNRQHIIYAFITFENAEEAKKAIELFNNTDVDGKTLRVEKANSKEPPKGLRKLKKKGPRNSNLNPNDDGNNHEGRSSDREDEKSDAAADANSDNADRPKQPETNNRRKGRARGGYRRRWKRTLNYGEPSTTTLYVSNLPFNLSDEGFQQVFASFEVKSARVVRHKYSGRSKGYGFVEFDSNAEQQRALSEVGIVEINGRTLTILVALSKPHAPSEEKSEKEDLGEASGEAPETQAEDAQP